MRDWIHVAQTLRAVRCAGEDFALRAVIDQTIIGPMLLDRVAGDLSQNYLPFADPLLQHRPVKDDES